MTYTHEYAITDIGKDLEPEVNPNHILAELTFEQTILNDSAILKQYKFAFKSDKLYVAFKDTLTANEITALNEIVYNHDGVETEEYKPVYDEHGRIGVNVAFNLGSKTDFELYDWSHPHTWWQDVERLTGIELIDSGDHQTYYIPDTLVATPIREDSTAYSLGDMVKITYDSDYVVNTSYSKGDIVKTTKYGDHYYFKALNDGTSGATEPDWMLVLFGGQPDNTIYWYPVDSKLLYKCTSAGTSASSRPFNWLDEPAETTDDGTVEWTAQHPNWFCDLITTGLVPNRTVIEQMAQYGMLAVDTYMPVLKVDGVEKTLNTCEFWQQGDYQMNFLNEYAVMLNTALTDSETVTLDYTRVKSSTYKLTPIEGKELHLERTKVIVANSVEMIRQTLNFVHLMNGQPEPFRAKIYESIPHFISECHDIKDFTAFAGCPCKSFIEDGKIMTWRYPSPIVLKSSLNQEIAIYINNDRPLYGYRTLASIYARSSSE